MTNDDLAAPLGKLFPEMEEIRQAQNAHLKAWNDGDMETYLAYTSQDLVGFDLHGDLADHARPYQSLRDLYEAGYHPHVKYRDRNLRKYGDTAVTTAYMVGTIDEPDGSRDEGVFRYSEVRVKEDGVWKLIQYHLSPLRMP